MNVCKLERVVMKNQLFLSAADLEGFEQMEMQSFGLKLFCNITEFIF